MNEAYEVELKGLTASFLPVPFDLTLGVEKLNILGLHEEGEGFTDFELQVVYQRVHFEDRSFFICDSLFEELEEKYGDEIAQAIFSLTQQL